MSLMPFTCLPPTRRDRVKGGSGGLAEPSDPPAETDFSIFLLSVTTCGLAALAGLPAQRGAALADRSVNQ
jgi:hypothetical protein